MFLSLLGGFGKWVSGNPGVDGGNYGLRDSRRKTCTKRGRARGHPLRIIGITDGRWNMRQQIERENKTLPRVQPLITPTGSTRTGSTRTVCISTTKSSSSSELRSVHCWIFPRYCMPILGTCLCVSCRYANATPFSAPSTRPSVVMPVSTGSPTPSTSTVRLVVLPPRARRTEVSARAPSTTTSPDVPAGRGTTREFQSQSGIQSIVGMGICERLRIKDTAKGY